MSSLVATVFLVVGEVVMVDFLVDGVKSIVKRNGLYVLLGTF